MPDDQSPNPRQKVYMPTPAQIARDCSRFQQTWDAHEKAKRAGRSEEPYQIPAVNTMIPPEKPPGD